MAVARPFGKSSVEAAEREMARLAALEELDLLDSPRDPGLDRLSRLIRSVYDIEIGTIALIDAHREWFKSCVGAPWINLNREETFCRVVVEREAPLIVPDTTRDPMFSGHPAVTGETHLRFYVGVPLRTGAGHVIGTVCAMDRRPRDFAERDLAILEEIADVAMDRIELQHSASSDSLTEALTRRAFREEGGRMLQQAVRHQRDVACLVLDIDHFKSVNDTHGHATGDEVLKQVSAACRTVLRGSDLLCRLGGEEFAIMLPDVDREAAMAVAEKVRTTIAGLVIEGEEESFSVTASIGLSSLSIIGRDMDTLLAQADAALYRAKRSGRNRCLAWSSGAGEDAIGSRRRVLKAGSIIFNDRRSTITCTVKTLGNDGAGLTVVNSAQIPPEFTLAIPGDNFETACRVISQDRETLEVMFR